MVNQFFSILEHTGWTQKKEFENVADFKTDCKDLDLS